ncbi:MAG: calcium/sodium antiporter [DPANN group archaeon]|nr:calcium/sodium antiporter [DPANN group archaeon]
MVFIETALLVIGLALLVKGADALIDASSKIARSFGISELIIGLTIVAFGTSFPELTVSSLAVAEGHAGISIGTILGSNILNICFIIAIIGFHTRYTFNDKKLLERDVVWLLVSAILFAATTLIGSVTRLLGLAFIALYAYYSFSIYRDFKKEEKTVSVKYLGTTWHDYAKLAISITVLYFGAKITVDNAILLSIMAGIPDWAIAATVIAIGTGLPEIVVSLVAIRRKQFSLSIGNIIGSNIFNILVVIGSVALIQPIPIALGTFAYDFLFLLITTVFVTVIVMRTWFHKTEALVAAVIYSLYILTLIARSLAV